MFKLGVLLILLSFIPWIVLPAVPWLANAASDRLKLTGGLIVLGELLFWPGLALAGKEAWNSAKAHGWRRVIPELLRKLRASRSKANEHDHASDSGSPESGISG